MLNIINMAEISFKWLKAPDDLSAVFAVREAVFVQEQGFVQEFDVTDQRCLHLLCLADGVPAGCARIFPEGEDCWHVGRVAVYPQYRGLKLGAALVKECHKKILALGGRKALLSAQCQAAGFYEKLGYQVISAPYLDEHCPHVDMVCDLMRLELRREGS